MKILAYSLLLFLMGWLAQSWLGGRWRWVPGKPKLRQDARHFWVRSDSRTLAFTAEQLEVAERRAYHLNEAHPTHERWRKLLWSVAVFALVAVLLIK